MVSDLELNEASAGKLRLSGELTFATVSSCVDRIDAHLSGERVELDVSGVRHADSASLALLLEWKRRAQQRQVRLRYVGLTDQMRSIAGLSDLEEVLCGE